MKLKVERGIPFPKDKTKELVKALCSLKDGDSVFLSYKETTKRLYLIVLETLGIK